MLNADLERRLRIIESSYGREHGWYLEHRGERIAVLSDPKWEDMFWTIYRIEPLSDDPKVREKLRSPQFWQSCDYVFRNRGFPDEVVDQTFGSLSQLEDEVSIRSLYITIEEPVPCEMLRCFRRLWRPRRRMRKCEGLRPPDLPSTTT